MACRVVALLVGLLSGAAMAGGAVSGESPAAVPWADLKDAAVLRVDQVADFGAALGPGDSLDIVIYQIAAVAGRGFAYSETLFF